MFFSICENVVLGRNKILTIQILSFVSQYYIPQFNVKHKTKQKGHKTVLWSLLCQKCFMFKSWTFWGAAPCFGQCTGNMEYKSITRTAHVQGLLNWIANISLAELLCIIISDFPLSEVLSRWLGTSYTSQF